VDADIVQRGRTRTADEVAKDGRDKDDSEGEPTPRKEKLPPPPLFNVVINSPPPPNASRPKQRIRVNEEGDSAPAPVQEKVWVGRGTVCFIILLQVPHN
jgi:hypothetical protein